MPNLLLLTPEYCLPRAPNMTKLGVSLLASMALLGLLAVTPSQVGAVDVTVSLNYSTYIGTAQAGTGVTQWLGIRYAAPPLGDLRFMPPQDPPVVSTPQSADQVGDYIHDEPLYADPSHNPLLSTASIASPPPMRPMTLLRQKTAFSSMFLHLPTPLGPQSCLCTFSSKVVALISTAIPTSMVQASCRPVAIILL